MPVTTQAKILRVLTDQSYHRVGGQRPMKVDVRVLSATARNLCDEIAGGRFREDLFYRLNLVPVRLPPLRERREDIPELASHFLARLAAERRMPPPTSRRKLWLRFRPMTGRATFASCATSSSGRSFWRRVITSLVSMSTCFPLRFSSIKDRQACPLRPSRSWGVHCGKREKWFDGNI